VHTERRLLILGTRTFAVEVADLASDIPGVTVAGFVENLEPDKAGTTLEGLPVHWIDEVASLAATHVAVCALSTTHRRRFVAQAAALGLPFTTLVHPTARVSRTARLAEGAIVNAGAILAAHAQIGRHAIVNRGALVGHHTVVGDYVTLGPGANIGGCCTLGEQTYVGIGAVVLDQITVGRHSIVGAGAVVTKPVADRVQVLGVPARVTREGIEGR
jgi:sugar O-acyltransferase (sialic acid O-acetyltransferase NeuD family)